MTLKLLPFISFSLFCCSLSAQRDSASGSTIDGGFYNGMSNLIYYGCGTGYTGWDKAFGVVPEYQFGNDAVSLGFFFYKASGEKWAIYEKGVTVNAGFLTKSNRYTASSDFWWRYNFISGFSGILGARGIAYWGNGEKTTFALRPEVGVALSIFHIKYGYDFTTGGENLLWHKNNNLTVSCFIPFWTN